MEITSSKKEITSSLGKYHQPTHSILLFCIHRVIYPYFPSITSWDGDPYVGAPWGTHVFSKAPTFGSHFDKKSTT